MTRTLEMDNMATDYQKETIKNLVYCNIEESFDREIYLGQLGDINQHEASLIIKSFEHAIY